MSNFITRFAPSPTGLLHIGNCRTALIAWLMIHSLNGKFLLRIDDTDKTRSTQEYEDGIKYDLEWLGLTWDTTFRQSERIDLYLAAKDKLIASGRLYPCYESQEELDIKRKNLIKQGLPPIYDRASLKLTDKKKTQLSSCGIKPHWRFLLTPDTISWHDMIRGDMQFKAEHITDPILFKEDGSMTYTLASVVDDIESNITHIIRGEDHLTNSATHIQIFKALGAEKIPQLAHLSLVNSKTGEISKRVGGFDIASLRQKGIESMAINSFLAKIGTSDPIECYLELSDLVKSFNVSKYSKAPINYDFEELQKFNSKLIHQMPFYMVKDRLDRLDMPFVDEKFWNAMHGNINTIAEAKTWYEVCYGEIKYIENLDKDFLKNAAKLLPDITPWDESIWEKWIQIIKANTLKRGKDLFLPLRVALTGQESGPEMKLLLPFIGREKILYRLQQ
jgi:glutamyl-tRNA synthetase